MDLAQLKRAHVLVTGDAMGSTAIGSATPNASLLKPLSPSFASLEPKSVSAVRQMSRAT